MKHTQILKRSWEIMWSYRALWIFGIILALTTGGSFRGNSQASSPAKEPNSTQGSFEPGDFNPDFREEFNNGMEIFKRDMVQAFEQSVPPHLRQTVITAAIVIAVIIMLIIIIGVFLRYISETAIIKMVDEYEQSGEKCSIRQGFSYGWSRSSWRLFLIDLTITLPVAIVSIALIALSVLVAISGFTGNQVTSMLGVVTGIGLLFMVLFCTFLIYIVLVVMVRYIYRSCVLDEKGVIDSIKQGYALTRHHLKDTGILALIMLGINIAFPVLLLPFTLLAAGIGLLVGGGSAAAVAFLTGVFSGTASIEAIISTIIIGGSIFILLLVLPISFLNGLKLIYQSSAWTLAYRELQALETLRPDAELTI